MAFSEIEIERIKKLVGSFCKTRVPEELRSEVSLDYELKAHTITIYEVRPKWNNPHEIKRKAFARIRWVQMRIL
jgi:hypothetical protein